MAALILSVTDAGRAALRNAKGDGTNAVLIASAGVTSQPFESGQPVPSEIKRLATISGGATAADTIHVTITDTGKDLYSVRGFGLYLADNTLFASYGQADVIVEKSTSAIMALSADIQFLEIDATQITFGDATFSNPAATSETLGVLKLASEQDAIDGKDSLRAVTPKGLLAALNDRLGKGAPSVLAKTMLARSQAADVRSDLSLKGAALKDEGAGRGLDADLLDGQHGDYYLDFNNAKNKPTSYPPGQHTHDTTDINGLASLLAAKLDALSRYVPGQIIVSASKSAPPRTLLCNGVALSRTTYAALFAAIGITYGAGDGSTTFNVPSLGEGCVIKATVDPNKVGTYSAGSLLTHTHGASAAIVADHIHGIALTAAGAHGHSASSGGVGDHTHWAYSDGQGWHGHTGSTSGGGGHQHLQTAGTVYAGNSSEIHYVGGSNGYLGANYRQWTDGAGDHSHSFSTDGNGTHSHNIGMNGAGGHSHDIYIGATGDHNHGVKLDAAGNHSHTITIAATGGSDNLAAGTHMFHFIAY